MVTRAQGICASLAYLAPLLVVSGCNTVSGGSSPAPAALSADPQTMRPIGLPKLLKAPGGRTITIVRVTPASENRYLLKPDGFAGPWNGRVVLHVRRDLGRNGEIYWTSASGSEWHTLTHRASFYTGEKVFEVRVHGDRGPYQARPASGTSSGAAARALVAAYRAQN